MNPIRHETLRTPVRKATSTQTVPKLGLLVAILAVAASTGPLHAAAISVPNGSFELQSGVGQIQGVNINIDSWQKADRPGYFPAEGFNGFFWVQVAGAFVDTNPYGNLAGTQAAYLLPFPTNALFQDYNTVAWNDAGVPSHDFDATFTVGNAYQLTLGVNGKIVSSSTLRLSLYYRDGAQNIVPVSSSTITSTGTYPGSAPYLLTDLVVDVPAVQSGDAWANEKIGILIYVISGDGNGNWDIDNVRLTSTPIPEPTTMGLALLGLGSLLLRRSRTREA
jgi:hypothetical protein